MDDPVTWDILVKFLCVFGDLMNDDKGHEALPIHSGEYQVRTPERSSLYSRYLPHSLSIKYL